jgi:peptidoglycan/xylan/chitin deacetylase (PgdA/CDA1 family)
MECEICGREIENYEPIACLHCTVDHEKPILIQRLAALEAELRKAHDELERVKAERDDWHRKAAWYESGDAAREVARHDPTEAWTHEDVERLIQFHNEHQ